MELVRKPGSSLLPYTSSPRTLRPLNVFSLSFFSEEIIAIKCQVMFQKRNDHSFLLIAVKGGKCAYNIHNIPKTRSHNGVGFQKNWRRKYRASFLILPRCHNCTPVYTFINTVQHRKLWRSKIKVAMKKIRFENKV